MASMYFEKDNNADENGHGTHTAGTVVGNGYGIAPGAKIFAIKVLDASGSGSNSDVIAGINWAYQHFLDSNKPPSIATMSLGGATNKPLQMAVQSAIRDGLHFTVAAGNDGMPADATSPANVEEALPGNQAFWWSRPV
ncbi:hypothetical protein FRC11_001851 [Ceratobasidium sp. 423]|nr:hypothetical protein FRC11_001851 [Ceratobasidium sp. 423]